jgi:hypothetical protein
MLQLIAFTQEDYVESKLPLDLDDASESDRWAHVNRALLSGKEKGESCYSRHVFDDVTNVGLNSFAFGQAIDDPRQRALLLPK